MTVSINRAAVVPTLIEGQRPFDIVVPYPEAYRRDLDDVRSAPIARAQR